MNYQHIARNCALRDFTTRCRCFALHHQNKPATCRSSVVLIARNILIFKKSNSASLVLHRKELNEENEGSARPPLVMVGPDCALSRSHLVLTGKSPPPSPSPLLLSSCSCPPPTCGPSPYINDRPIMSGQRWSASVLLSLGRKQHC